MSRVLNEAKARRYEVGVMVASSSALEPLSREKLLTAVKSPLLADLVPGSVAPNREWASVYLNTFVQAYNTNLVKKDELPKTYRDLSIRAGRAGSRSRPRTTTGSRRS